MCTLTLQHTVCAVPELALLLVSGVLECWKHLAGRFNIQLTGSQTSYITADINHHLLPSSLHPGFLPTHCPSLWSDLSIPLFSCAPFSSAFVWAVRGRTDSAAALSVHQRSCWLHLIWMDCFSFGGYCHPPHPPPHISRLWSGRVVPRW